MASPARHAGSSGNFSAPFPNHSAMHFKTGFPGVHAAPATTVLSLEFVARPENARSAPVSLPGQLQAGLEDVPGFAGSLVLVADQEPRLITVVIFWHGTEGHTRCSQSLRRVRALVAPFVDRNLRLRTMMAHRAAPCAIPPEPNADDADFTLGEPAVREEAICAA